MDLHIHSPIRLSCGVVNNSNIEDITTNKEQEVLRTDSLLSSDSTRTANKTKESGGETYK